MRSPHCTIASIGVLLAVATALVPPARARAQNPISSKVVGSDVARRNRHLISRFRADGKRRADSVATPTSEMAKRAATLVTLVRSRGSALDSARVANYLADHTPVVAQRRLLAQEVFEYLKLTNPADTMPVGGAERRSKIRGSCFNQTIGVGQDTARVTDTLSTAYMLELLCKVPELESVVPNAIRIVLTHARRDPLASRMVNAALADSGITWRDPLVEALAAAALDRVLQAVEKGHTNPQRYYLGGQLGLGLVGDHDDGIAARASARAAYFVPISPLGKMQLPVVTNLADIASAPQESQKDKLKKVTTSSEGAFLSLEPTWDPVFPTSLKDLRLQFFGAVGGQLNTLREKIDTSKTVQFAQGRVGGGMNIELGIPGPGRPSLFLTTRAVMRFYSPGSSQRVFGTRNRGTPLIESFALVPIGAGTSILAEVSTARHASPVVRIALWAQATPQKGS